MAEETMMPGSLSSPETMKVRIEKLVYGGEGLARTPDGVLLVPLVAPGEAVAVEPGELHKGVRHGRMAEVLEPSADRISAPCPYFARCGGCHYQHLRYEQQLEIKREILLECFARLGNVSLEVPVDTVSGEQWQYRNRSRLQIEKRSGDFEIGYYELLSHKLCPIEQCPISSPAINAVIAQLCQGAGTDCFPEGDAELELFGSDHGDAILATIYAKHPAPAGFAGALRAAIPAVTSVAWIEENSRRRTKGGETRLSQPRTGSLIYRVGELHYRVSHDSFFQTNRYLLNALIDVVMAGLEGKRALDLYAGVGLFSIPLAHRFERVAAVESAPSSAADLATNLGVVSDRARSYPLSVEKFMATASSEWDIIIADPPRAGLSRPVLENIARIKPRHFVYVSCDPTTLARDVGSLTRTGFGIKSVHMIDLFPQTFHIETVVHMQPLA
jgi:23S rRNA (uracil1939-C5)-methyltransferase